MTECAVRDVVMVDCTDLVPYTRLIHKTYVFVGVVDYYVKVYISSRGYAARTDYENNLSSVFLSGIVSEVPHPCDPRRQDNAVWRVRFRDTTVPSEVIDAAIDIIRTDSFFRLR